MTNPMNNYMTDSLTYPITDPLMKTLTMTKTMIMIMKKTLVQNCDVRAVSHSCDAFLCFLTFSYLFLTFPYHSLLILLWYTYFFRIHYIF